MIEVKEEITFRDYLAAKAMVCFCNTSMLSFYGTESTEKFDSMVANRAYEIADAMIDVKQNKGVSK